MTVLNWYLLKVIEIKFYTMRLIIIIAVVKKIKSVVFVCSRIAIKMIFLANLNDVLE